jgi:acyl phosphate:glycerol-3-phosphate acyltransferase
LSGRFHAPGGGHGVAAYLIGSLSFAVLVSRVMGLNDPRTYGSKNPGATNVLRSGNKAAAVVTLLLDALKGWLPVVGRAALVGLEYGLADGTVALVGLAAFLGHLFPLFFRFQAARVWPPRRACIIGLEPWLGRGGALLTWAQYRGGTFSAIRRWPPLSRRCSRQRFTCLAAASPGALPGVIALSLGCDGCAAGVAPRGQHFNRLLAGKESKIGSKKAAG